MKCCSEIVCEELIIPVIDGEQIIISDADADAEIYIERDGEYGIVTQYCNIPSYTGPTEYTPTQYTQTVHTANKQLSEDIIINPIPSNYGLITWNGRALTVS